MKGIKVSILGGLTVFLLSATIPSIHNIYAFDGDSFDYQTDNFKEIEPTRGLPTRGMASGTVIAKFGEPVRRNGPVGDPPISTWFYENFNVYLERHLVITAVATDDRLPPKLKEIQ